jgi:hypothetical protein
MASALRPRLIDVDQTTVVLSGEFGHVALGESSMDVPASHGNFFGGG